MDVNIQKTDDTLKDFNLGKNQGHTEMNKEVDLSNTSESIEESLNQSTSLKFSDLDRFCTNLEKSLDETLYISVNLSDNKFMYGGSTIGRNFLQVNSDMVESFFKFCKAKYGHSESCSSDGKSTPKTKQSIKNAVNGQDCHIYIDDKDSYRKDAKKRKFENKVEKTKIYQNESSKKSKVDAILTPRRRSKRVKNSEDILKKAQMRKADMDSFSSAAVVKTEKLEKKVDTQDNEIIQDETKQKKIKETFFGVKTRVNVNSMTSQASCLVKNEKPKIEENKNSPSLDVVCEKAVLQKRVLSSKTNTLIDTSKSETNLQDSENMTKNDEMIKIDDHTEKIDSMQIVDNDLCGGDGSIDVTVMEVDDSSNSDDILEGYDIESKNNQSSIINKEDRHNPGHGTVNCRLCGQTLLLRAYPFHLRRAHKELNAFKCNECENSFNTLFALKKHKLLHRNKEAVDKLNRDDCSPCPEDEGQQQPKEEQKDHFLCNVCLKVFRTRASLNNHTVMLHNDRLRCKVCNKQCSTLQRLAIHETIHRDKKYPCKDCDKDFTNANTYIMHARKDHSEKRPACYLCGIFFETEVEKNQHSLTHKNDRISNYACPRCGKTFENLKYLKAHNKIVHRGNEVICKVCCEFFKSKIELKKHKWIHRLDPMHLCRVCKNSFKTTDELKKHTKDVHNSRFYICDACGEEFQCAHDLKKHQSNIHDSEAKLSCKICGAIFLGKKHLRQHTEQVHRTTRDFQCDECGMFFKTKGVLLSHTKRHREVNKCELCEATFKSIDGLHNHILASHADIISIDKLDFKVYECEFCGKRSSQKAIHIRHVRTHTGEKPYVCLECGAKFPVPYALTRHVNRNHLGLKKHYCKICDKKFAEHSHLLRHYETSVHKLREASSNSMDYLQSGCNKGDVTSQIHSIPLNQETMDQSERKKIDVVKSDGQPSMEEVKGYEKENIQVIYVDHIAQTNDSIKQEAAEQVYAVENTSLLNFQDSTIYVISETEDPDAFVQSLSFTK